MSLNSTGAVISHSEEIHFPNQSEHLSHIALDIGGSLAKVIWLSPSPCGNGGRLNFTKYETEKIDECIQFVKFIMEKDVVSQPGKKRIVKATGGGAHKFCDMIAKKLYVTLQKEDEMECLITGLNFLVRQIPNEVFTYDERRSEPLEFETSYQQETFPYMLVNIGSGVSIIKVTSDETFERISGTSLGGGTLWGLLSLLTDAETYDDMLELSKQGDNKNVDMLVGDIYGGGYSKIGLKATTIASSFGKVFKASKEERKKFKQEDISRSLLYLVSNNIGQIAYLNAIAHGIQRIYFSGFFICGHPITMNTLSYAINFWSKGSIKALFLRHEGYLGAMGAFLRDTKGRRHGSFSAFKENFSLISKISGNFPSAVGAIDTLSMELVPFPHLRTKDYNPDTLDLSDPIVQSYWINLLDQNLGSLVDLALEWQGETKSSAERAKSFEIMYRGHLQRLRQQPSSYGVLTVRGLLDLREQCLKEMGFVDVFEGIKKIENEKSMKLLPNLLNELDKLAESEKIEELISNILAGNMYDWGSRSIEALLKKGEIEFEKAKKQVGRPTKFNHVRQLKEHLISKKVQPYKKCIIFVDNSGADIVLGIIPFARYLLQKEVHVILAANSYPCVNDVTESEMRNFFHQLKKLDDVLARAIEEKKLQVLGTGSSSPCLDLLRISDVLADAANDADLIILEGMGRAIHTNFKVKLNVDCLKIAVCKNPQVASVLQVNLYDGICLYERSHLDS